MEVRFDDDGVKPEHFQEANFRRLPSRTRASLDSRRSQERSSVVGYTRHLDYRISAPCIAIYPRRGNLPFRSQYDHDLLRCILLISLINLLLSAEEDN